MMKTANSLCGIVFMVYGLCLIFGIGGSPGFLRTINLEIDPVGFGAFFFLLGAWIVMKDRKGNGGD